MKFSRKEKPPGRHSRQAAPAAPPAAPAPAPQPAPAAPVTLGAGARLTAGGPPGAGPAFTGFRPAPGGPPAAVISLGGGWEVEVTRAVWLDALAEAARDARDAARQARQAEIEAAGGPRFTPAADPPPDEERM